MRNALILFAVMAIGFILYSQDKQTKLAVMEIDDKSGKLSKTLLENAAEALRSEIGATNKFVLISKDRQRKAMIKGEKKESWKECYDQSCRVQLGQALTADNILTGIVTLFGGTYTLTVELIDLAKEATIKTAKADFDGTEKGLAEAIKSIVNQIAGTKKTFQTGKTGERVDEWEIGQGEETIVKFESRPADAVVMVDGKILCQKTPCSKMLTQGMHEVTIQKENYIPVANWYNIVKGGRVEANLEADFGWIEVTANYTGIDIILDGKNIGKTPITKRELNPGPHQVDSSHNCFYQTGEKFVLNRGELKKLNLLLQPKEAGIKVMAQDNVGNDLEADVLVDGKKIGQAPGSFKVPLCSREIVVQTNQLVHTEPLGLKEKEVKTVVAKLKTKDHYAIKDGVVLDSKTGLSWQRECAPTVMKHENAIKYCENLSLGDYDDWRLPSISELKTLIVGCQSGTDACKVNDNCLSSSCYSDSCHCAGNKGPAEEDYYWQKGVWQGGGKYFLSSSVLSDDSRRVWGVGFVNFAGGVGPTHRNGSASVRCVRGKIK